MKPTFHFLRLNNVPIFNQLQIEEALLRADQRNWCLVNEGSQSAIVMGISGKYEQLINHDLISQNPVPLIRRFSGGGTVFIDEQTSFYTLIGNRDILNVPCYPERLLRWTEELYAPAFAGHSFSLRENDYVMGNKKFGGNAQYLCKNRWLHHSSFLWDFDEVNMEYLLMPPKIPTYREKRSHSSFLCRLKEFFNEKCLWHNQMRKTLDERFTIIEVPYESIEEILGREHRKATKKLSDGFVTYHQHGI